MKYLALASLLCVLVSSSNAQCFAKPVTSDHQAFCQDDVDNTWHPVGSKWRNSACMDCTCTQCCAGYATPTNYPDDCVSVFDPVACKYIVHKKDDPSVECPILGAVGK